MSIIVHEKYKKELERKKEERKVLHEVLSKLANLEVRVEDLEKHSLTDEEYSKLKKVLVDTLGSDIE